MQSRIEHEQNDVEIAVVSSDNSEKLAIEQIIQKLKSLKHQLSNLQNKMQKDDVLLSEYKLIIQKNINKTPYLITPLFNSEILEPVRALMSAYSEIKMQLLQYIPQDELKNIEASVKGKNNKNNLLFFPSYQEVYLSKATQTKPSSKPQYAIDKTYNKIRDIKNNYKHRRYGYDGYGGYEEAYLNSAVWIAFCGLGTLGVLITATVHAVDKITSEIHIAKLKHSIKPPKIATNLQTQLFAAELHKSIDKNPEMKVRQQFFKLAKTRYERDFNNLTVVQLKK